MGNSTTGIPDSTEKHLHRFFINVLWNYDGVREITEQGVEMIRLIGSELYRLRKSFYNEYLYWQTQDKKTLKKINELIKSIKDHYE